MLGIHYHPAGETGTQVVAGKLSGRPRMDMYIYALLMLQEPEDQEHYRKVYAHFSKRTHLAAGRTEKPVRLQL